MLSAAFIESNWKIVVTQNTDQDNFILLSFSNSTGLSDE